MSGPNQGLALRPVEPDFLPTLKRAANRRSDFLPVAEQVAARQVSDLYLVGCGGSYASSIHAHSIIQAHAPALAAWLMPAHEFAANPPARLGRRSLVVAASHSGRTPETVGAARLAAGRGALVVSLSRDLGTELASTAHHAFAYGSERTVTPAKQILLAQLALQLGEATGGSVPAAWHDAILPLPEALQAAVAASEDRLAAAAALLAGAPLTFVIAAGPAQGAGYLLSMCYLMEMQWMRSAFFPAGEFFHGAFEMLTGEAAAVTFVGEGPDRALAERAVSFARQHTSRAVTLDSANLELPGIAPAARAFVAPIALGVLANRLADHLEAATGHSLDERRYMGKGGY